MPATSDDPAHAAGPPLEVVIAGGGVAALEAALALHELAGERVRMTLVAPTTEFVYRPMAVLEPFVELAPRTLPLEEFAADVGAAFLCATLVSVDPEQRVLHTAEGDLLAYDALLIAVGARAAALLPGADAMDPSRMEESLGGLIEAIDEGAVHRLGFIAPSSAWPLPVYEVALLATERARERGVKLDVTIITAEHRPLGVFGEKVSSAMAGLLVGSRIEVVTGAWVHSSGGRLTLHPEGREVALDRLVAVPKLMGPEIAGLPADADGFLPTGPDGGVSGVERVYAAGDATDFPVKWGGIAAQQADAAATSIAALAGVADRGGAVRRRRPRRPARQPRAPAALLQRSDRGWARRGVARQRQADVLARGEDRGTSPGPVSRRPVGGGAAVGGPATVLGGCPGQAGSALRRLGRLGQLGLAGGTMH